jgi:hypothetical protein
VTLRFISWIYPPWWLPLGMIVGQPVDVRACVGGFQSRKVIALEPGRVFPCLKHVIDQ